MANGKRRSRRSRRSASLPTRPCSESWSQSQCLRSRMRLKPLRETFVFLECDLKRLADDVIAVAVQIPAVAFKLLDQFLVKFRLNPFSGPFLLLWDVRHVHSSFHRANARKKQNSV